MRPASRRFPKFILGGVIDPRTTAAMCNHLFLPAACFGKAAKKTTESCCKTAVTGGNPASAEDRHPRQSAERQTTDSGVFINNHEKEVELVFRKLFCAYFSSEKTATGSSPKTGMAVTQNGREKAGGASRKPGGSPKFLPASKPVVHSLDFGDGASLC